MTSKIKEIRNHFNYSQTQLANKLDCHRSRISDAERGTRGFPGSLIKPLCTQIGINLNWFFADKGAMLLDYDEKTSSYMVEDEQKNYGMKSQKINLLERIIKDKESIILEKDKRIKLLEELLKLKEK